MMKTLCGNEKRYLVDLAHSIELNRWILNPIAAWPISSSGFIDTMYNKIIRILVVFMILFIVGPCILFVIFEVNDTFERLRFTGPLSFFFMAILKYLFLIWHQDDIVCCIETMRGDWNDVVEPTNVRKIMLKNANFGRRLIGICSFFMYGGAVFFYLIVPFTTGLVHDVISNDTYLPLVYPVPMILINTKKTPINEIFFLLQCASGFLAHNITTGACSLAAVMAMHACGQLDVLKIWLEGLVGGESHLVGEKLGRIIKHHVRVLKFISTIQRLLREISFVEIVGCTLNICLIGYYVIREWNDKETIRLITFFILWISMTFNIFIFCYIGELLSEQCLKMGESSYMIEWYDLPKKKGLDLVLSIAMSYSTRNLSAGNFVELSLSSFASVIQSSFAYLNMLRTVTKI